MRTYRELSMHLGRALEAISRGGSEGQPISAVERHVGFRRVGAAELKGLDGWLEEQALEHDRPVTLFAMACDHLMAEGVVRLGVTTTVTAARATRVCCGLGLCFGPNGPIMTVVDELAARPLLKVRPG